MASGPLKIKKGTCPVLILATHRHTTESVGWTVHPLSVSDSFILSREWCDPQQRDYWSLIGFLAANRAWQIQDKWWQKGYKGPLCSDLSWLIQVYWSWSGYQMTNVWLIMSKYLPKGTGVRASSMLCMCSALPEIFYDTTRIALGS